MNCLVQLGLMAIVSVALIACGEDGGSAAPVDPVGDENSAAVEVSSSSDFPCSSTAILTGSSPASAPSSFANTPSTSSSSAVVESSSNNADTTVDGDTSRITYTLRRFDGPLTNPHKGFTVPTEAAWTFDPGFEYGPHGSLNNGAWNLVTYGSGYQQWNKLNPAKDVYDWSELEELLDALTAHNMGYALRVFPYSPSFIRDDSTPEENYDWTPKYVYEEGAKKITARYKENNANAAVPVWDDSVYLHYAKEFATALAAKYDGDPRIEYIDVRSFGEWGEWHVSNLDGSHMPSVEIQKDMLKHYASVFKKSLLVLPSDGYGDVYTYALSLGITKRDDCLIGIPGTADSLVRAYEANMPTVAENCGGYAIMLNYTDVIPGGYLKWTPERWVDAIRTAHLTYYVLDQDFDDCGYRFYNDNKALADSMTKVIGYNFTVMHAELLTVTGADTASTLNITVKNTGVAPCFFDIYMVAEFVDSTGKALAQIGETVRIPKGTFKDESSQDFAFTYKVTAEEKNVATLSGVSVALSLYESEDTFRGGMDPTVRFDNEGLQKNNKLLLKP
ncbi:beta-galactosidase [uncultured Fibrobacter sp.]|uniref:beta-galactosidase n=1 Tax=uncultured Fibrobacter sp. TaxID=261512 RepID=UPI00263165F4|nr:beta-galactosidase [uncultured Fibrobacter sp.]